MGRRAFLLALTFGTLSMPLAAKAQLTANQVRRIGVLMHNAQNDPESKAELAAFRQGLQQLGWSEGRNIRIDIRFAADRPDQYEVLAKTADRPTTRRHLRLYDAYYCCLAAREPHNPDRLRRSL